MHRKVRSHDSVSSISSRMTVAALWLALAVVATSTTQAQTFRVIHDFTNGPDGGTSFAGVTMDAAGNLYGTTYLGGNGYGTVYRLKRSGSNFLFNTLLSFDWTGGAYSDARVVFGPQGLLYGTTSGGGPYSGGVIFKLSPPPSLCKATHCPWIETVLYTFVGGSNDSAPALGDVLFDQAGNMYNTANGSINGGYGLGVVYELAPVGNWQTQTILHSFDGPDGEDPLAGLVFDNAGNLYGTTYWGGANGLGAVFELTKSGSGWAERILYSFVGGTEGSYPIAGLIFDRAGNLYGAAGNSRNGGGLVFELTPSGDNWTYNVIYSFAYAGNSDVCGPEGNLVTDAAGNLYYCSPTTGVCFRRSNLPQRVFNFAQPIRTL